MMAIFVVAFLCSVVLGAILHSYLRVIREERPLCRVCHRIVGRDYEWSASGSYCRKCSNMLKRRRGG